MKAEKTKILLRNYGGIEMKVAINRCFGGFGLSTLAISEILKRKGMDCFVYEQTEYAFKTGKDKYVKTIPSASSSFGTYTLLRDYGDVIYEIPWNDKMEDGQSVVKTFTSFDTDRTDSDLIAVIEELGDDASGSCSALSIVDIPDDIEWEISNYDGMETIEEVHRSWC